jgi:hypothetical protein
MYGRLTERADRRAEARRDVIRLRTPRWSRLVLSEYVFNHLEVGSPCIRSVWKFLHAGVKKDEAAPSPKDSVAESVGVCRRGQSGQSQLARTRTTETAFTHPYNFVQYPT